MEEGLDWLWRVAKSCFFFVRKQKSKHAFFPSHSQVFVTSYWDQKVNSILGVQQLSIHPVIQNLPAFGSLELLSEYYSAKQLVRH